MVSSTVVALALAALVQVVCSSHIPQSCPGVRYEEGCCPGQVVEKKFVTHRTVTEPYSYQVPVYSKKCCQKPAGVDKQVIPKSFETRPVCETQETIVKVPTTDLEEQNQPLCKRTCTTSRYIVQIPITETTCTNSPLCRKTIRSQDNLLTTVSEKTSCAKQQCTQNTVVQKPVFETVCQDYQQSINKVGTKTVLKPEIKKYCYQNKPYRCLKPVYDDDATSSVGLASDSSFASANAAAFSCPALVPDQSFASANAAAITGPDLVSDSSFASANAAAISAPALVSGSTYASVNGAANYEPYFTGTGSPYYPSPIYGPNPSYQPFPIAAPCSCAC